MEELRFWIPVVVSIGALVAAVLGWLSSRRSADAAVRSAGASETSADQAKRSADVAVSSYKLQLQPYVVAVVATKEGLRSIRPYRQIVNTVYVENRGTGVAYEVTAKLKIGLAGDAAETPHDHEVPALRPGDREEIDPVPSTGRLEIWGRVSFVNAEGDVRVLECSRGERWREVDE